MCSFCLSFKFLIGFELGVLLSFSACYIIYTQDNALLVKLLHNRTL